MGESTAWLAQFSPRPQNTWLYDGKVTNYSFSNDSDALISTTYLKRISKVFKYYEQKGKKIIPASENNKYKDFTITFKVKYKG